jgi:hypothetical protein
MSGIRRAPVRAHGLGESGAGSDLGTPTVRKHFGGHRETVSRVAVLLQRLVWHRRRSRRVPRPGPSGMCAGTSLATGPSPPPLVCEPPHRRWAMSVRYSAKELISTSLNRPRRIKSAVTSSQAVSSTWYRAACATDVCCTIGPQPSGSTPSARSCAAKRSARFRSCSARCRSRSLSSASSTYVDRGRPSGRRTRSSPEDRSKRTPSRGLVQPSGSAMSRRRRPADHRETTRPGRLAASGSSGTEPCCPTSAGHRYRGNRLPVWYVPEFPCS